ncbi:MAG: hypothetical protein KC431_03200, partial [Myxococcales bacterium]|nr:hypothetical protein [Myxococcales bacterium]
EAGLVDPLGSVYQFAHSGIRTAIYGQIDVGRRRRLHAAIGRHLLRAGGGAAALIDRPRADLFMVVDQLDAGFMETDRGSDDETDIVDLAALNVHAGQRAMNDGAWQGARRYFAQAEALFGREDVGEVSSELRFSARLGLAQSQLLAGELEAAETGFAELLS